MGLYKGMHPLRRRQLAAAKRAEAEAKANAESAQSLVAKAKKVITKKKSKKSDK